MQTKYCPDCCQGLSIARRLRPEGRTAAFSFSLFHGDNTTGRPDDEPPRPDDEQQIA